MKLIKPSYEILTPLKNSDVFCIYQNIERAGRISWKSEDKMTSQTCEKFIPMIMFKNHESVLEHESISVKFTVDRGVMAELTRHRLASFTIESSRYCNYSKDKFDANITFIIPPWTDLGESNWTHKEIMDSPFTDATFLWMAHCAMAETAYLDLLKYNWTPQQARDVLPMSLKTEIIMTCNIRELRHILTLRTSPAAHPQMREVMVPLLKELQQKLPLLFEDIKCE